MKTLTRDDLEEILTEIEFVQVELTCNECLSTKEKADRLNRSTDTVNSHMKNIFRKLDISKVTELSKIYFTASILLVTFCLHGLYNTQIRYRIRLIEEQTVLLNQRRLRNRRRERSTSLSTHYYHNEVKV